jgi:NAD(P)-dependent dehydrogenase (short-subunit alcohol dehydrogenase family)
VSLFTVIGIDINDTKIPNIHRFYKLDCSNQDEIKSVFNEIKSIDIAINCAGIGGVRKNILELTPTDILDVINSNFISMFMCNKEQIKIMRKQNKGKIINFSSILAHIGVQESLTYSASKAAIHILTKVAAAENKQYGIQINSISPATINTPLVKKINLNNKKKYEEIYPIGHMGQIDDIVSVVNMLINNNFMTGNDIILDGGLTNIFNM